MHNLASLFLGITTFVGGLFGAPQQFGTAIFQVIQGGTGSSTLTGVLVGNGTSAVNTLTIGNGVSLTGTTLTATLGTNITPSELNSALSANSLPYANSAGSAFVSAATSTLYGTCTGGQVIGWSNTTGGLTCLATSTVASSGSVGNWFTPDTFGVSAANSTSTLIKFTQGIASLASSTIGDGSVTGGLTINGGATTTTDINVLGRVVQTGASQNNFNSAVNTSATVLVKNFTALSHTASDSQLKISDTSSAIDVGVFTNQVLRLLVATTTGNVGIATGSPSQALSVHGNELVSGTSTVGNLYATSTLTIAPLGASAGQCLTTNVNGLVITTTCGSGGSVGNWFTPDSNFGALANSTSTAVWFKVGLQASSTSQFVNASTTMLSVDGYPIATTTATVCKQSGYCQFTTIQSALNSGARNIFVKNGTYSEQLTFQNTKTKLIAESLNTIIQANGATQSPVVTPTDESIMDGFTFNETNAALVGTVWDASDHTLTTFRNNRVNNFATSTKFTDGANTTFYNRVENNTFFNVKTCFEFDGTQANANWIYGNRCRPMAVDGAFGAYVIDARGINFTNNDVEGTTTTKATVGYYFDATSRDDLVNGGWTEAFGTGLLIAAGANNISVIGTTMTSHGTDISDSGTNTTLLGVNRTGTKLFHLPLLAVNGSTTITSVGSGLVGANNGLLYGFASSSLFGYTPLNPTRSLTIAGTAQQITLSAGAQDLSADRTWTVSLPNYVKLPSDFSATNGSTTNATSTNLSVTGSSTLSTLFGAALASCNSASNALTWNAGLFGCNTISPVGGFDFTPTTNYAVNTSATTTPIFAKGAVGGIYSFMASNTAAFDQIIVGSSTTSGLATSTFFGNLTVSGNASSTGLVISGLANGSNRFLTVNSVGQVNAVALPLSYPNGGTGTTTGVQGQLRYFGSSADQAVATSSASCSSGITCTGFTVVGTVSPSITNSGVTSNVAGTGITVSGATGAVTITNAIGYEFTPTNNFAVIASATGTQMLLTAGLSASSTVRFGNAATVGQFTWNSTLGNLGLGTTSPYAELSIAAIASSTLSTLFAISSTTNTGGVYATTTLLSIDRIGSLIQNGNYAQFGTGSVLDTAYCALGKKCLVFSGSDNTTSGINIEVANTSNGTGAYATFNLNNDLTDSSGTHYSALDFTSSGYTDTSFGTALAVKNNLQLVNSDGPITFNAATSTSVSYINFVTGGAATANERLRIDASGYVGIGTTTPWALLSVNPTNTLGTLPAFVVGSSTQTSFIIDNKGFVGLATTSPWARFTLDRSNLPGGLASSSILVTEWKISTTTNKTIDARDGNTQLFQIGSAATTITLSGFLPGTALKLIVCNPNGAPGAITWATSPAALLLWAGGTAPTMTTTANKCDVVSFIGTGATTTVGSLGKIFGAATQNF